MAWNDAVMNDDGEAARRAALTRGIDPFPSIPCSLLSSAEVVDYARETGMLCPFFPEHLKPASYEAHIGGSFVYWDQDGNKTSRVLRRGDRCLLPANSITFVQVEPKFRLPNYIALRFNLRITHVHRGLLLGTGPLVDPGFEGKLLIPLHNLTDQDYEIDTREALIWIEFTKTTFGIVPGEAAASADRRFSGFPDSKKNKDPDYYFDKASKGQPIRSSIGGALARSEQAALSAKDKAKSMSRTVRNVGIGATIALVLSLSTITWQILDLIHSVSTGVDSISQRVSALEAENTLLKEELNAFETRLSIGRQANPGETNEVDDVPESTE